MNKTLKTLLLRSFWPTHACTILSTKHISAVKRAVPQSWGTSNGIFNTDKVGDIEISFIEYLTSKKVCLKLDVMEYNPGGTLPMYDLIIGKETLHNLGVCVCFWPPVSDGVL